jgi:uncharacterized protein YjbI with pentapeptide repeats
MAKRWLAIREKSLPVLRRSLIGLFSLTVVVGAVYLVKPWFWPGGLGMDKGETVTTERVEKDAKGIPVKTTTKHDDGKTLWDWLSLLGVPLSLAFLGLWFQWIQQKRSVELAQEQRVRDEKLAKEQREIAADETKEEVLQVYFDRLSALLVDKNLLAIAFKVYATETQENEGQPKIEATLEERELLDSAVDVIQARTLSILRRFENDAERKTSVIRFLIEAHIVSKLKLSLCAAHLSEVNFNRHDDLSQADLSGANLYYSKLNEVNLSEANLSGAVLREAKLNGAKLNGANLSGANLRKAELISADLRNANLRKAIFSSADLRDADLRNANLSGTNLNRANLSGARFSINVGLTDSDKADMKKRGAIFKDSPESDVPSFVKR